MTNDKLLSLTSIFVAIFAVFRAIFRAVFRAIFRAILHNFFAIFPRFLCSIYFVTCNKLVTCSVINYESRLLALKITVTCHIDFLYTTGGNNKYLYRPINTNENQ